MSFFVKYEGLGSTRVSLGEPSYDPTYVPTKEAIAAVEANLRGEVTYAALPMDVQEDYLKILGHLENQGIVMQTWDRGFVVKNTQQHFFALHMIKRTRSGRAY